MLVKMCGLHSVDEDPIEKQCDHFRGVRLLPGTPGMVSAALSPDRSQVAVT